MNNVKILRPLVSHELIAYLQPCAIKFPTENGLQETGAEWFDRVFPNGATTEENLAAIQLLNNTTFYEWAYKATCEINTRLIKWHISQGVPYMISKYKVFNPMAGQYIDALTLEEADTTKQQLLDAYVASITASYVVNAVVEVNDTDADGNITGTHETWMPPSELTQPV